MASGILLPIDRLVHDALSDYTRDVFATPWYGKEHDHVNLFAFGYLVPRCSSDGPLQHPTQLGLGVAMCQPSGVGANKAARKDLVIWPKPRMSCWSLDGMPSHHPLALMEWKVRRPGKGFIARNRDRKWLAEYSKWQPGFVGYSVALDLEARKWRLSVERFHGGYHSVGWLQL